MEQVIMALLVCRNELYVTTTQKNKTANKNLKQE